MQAASGPKKWPFSCRGRMSLPVTISSRCFIWDWNFGAPVTALSFRSRKLFRKRVLQVGIPAHSKGALGFFVSRIKYRSCATGGCCSLRPSISNGPFWVVQDSSSAIGVDFRTVLFPFHLDGALLEMIQFWTQLKFGQPKRHFRLHEKHLTEFLPKLPAKPWRLGPRGHHVRNLLVSTRKCVTCVVFSGTHAIRTDEFVVLCPLVIPSYEPKRDA